jgi:hypothetical protein
MQDQRDDLGGGQRAIRDRDPEIVRPDIATLEAHLRDAIVDRVTSTTDLLSTLVDLCVAGHVPDVPPTNRGTRWQTIVERMVHLDVPSSYVGGFKIRLDEIIELAEGLRASDRLVLARLVLDRTVACTPTSRDLRHGILAARAIEPLALAPADAVDALLRPCLRYATSAHGESLIVEGLMVTLDILATGSGRSVTDADLWALRAAAVSVPDEQRDELRLRVERLKGSDRARVERLVAPPSKRWWSRARGPAHADA